MFRKGNFNFRKTNIYRYNMVCLTCIRIDYRLPTSLFIWMYAKHTAPYLNCIHKCLTEDELLGSQHVQENIN